MLTRVKFIGPFAIHWTLQRQVGLTDNSKLAQACIIACIPLLILVTFSRLRPSYVPSFPSFTPSTNNHDIILL